MQIKYVLLILLVTAFGVPSESRTITFKTSVSATKDVIHNQLRMGDPGPEGKALKVNNRYLTLNGQPVIPVMGECHYSRIPRNQWEDVLLKMKACGINIVASYVVWIHHEEVEGHFDWSGNKDLRAFAELCRKHDLWFYPRIGPWVHAEVRNGGTPDWILTNPEIKDRSNDAEYQHYAEGWYKQIGLQLNGLMYKDGGPVIGVQLENEYRRGRGGEAHILWLKNTARKYGFDVPLYTVTGWGNASVPAYEVIPLYGGYPDAPWQTDLNRGTSCDEFEFKPFRDSETIGNEGVQVKKPYVDNNAYPYFTCEVGVGIMNTDHRRLFINSKDGPGIIMSKIGSGSNLPGYYMFAGGTNPHGILTTLEENKEETGYWNTNPVVSYDFQAAIRESGQLNRSYFEVKKLHYFLNEFGDRLAPMEPVFPFEPDELNCALRTDQSSAFLFVSNYCRHNKSGEKKNIQFSAELHNETVTFPSKNTNIPDSAMFIWPVNFKMGVITLRYATVQPMCRVNNTWIFFETPGVDPELCFDAEGISEIKLHNNPVEKTGGNYVVKGIKPGLSARVSITGDDGSEINVIVLDKKEALNGWLLRAKEEKHFFVSDAGLYLNQEKLKAFSTSAAFDIYQLTENGSFNVQSFNVPVQAVKVGVHETKPLDSAKWLISSEGQPPTGKSKLMHRFFLKEFMLNNASDIKSATLTIYVQGTSHVQVNSRWINSNIKANRLNTIDMTGYVQKGENKLLLEFPYQSSQQMFAAKLEVNYFNRDRETIYSDQSWLANDNYRYPSFLTDYNGFKAPKIIEGQRPEYVCDITGITYALMFPDDYPEGLNNLYLEIDYTGNKARVYHDGRLIADDFYNGTTWSTGINRLGFYPAGQILTLEIDPLKDATRVYFDIQGAAEKAKEANVESVRLIPEYKMTFEIKNDRLIRDRIK
ncbi:beta-galactosidase [Saccharicrinis sp. FJH54]|uniref:beta-galactosidase n=1 Tax=Saccharicrinis sp. FJH54 TaxID=3344665 RepID=UPI0035D4B112